MKVYWQKPVSFLFLVLGMLPAIFMLLVCIKKNSIRHEMKEKMEKQLLHTIALKNENIVWVKANKEIVVDGKMFDVKFYTTTNGVTTFTGLYDEEETRLNAVVNKEMGGKSEKQNSFLAQIVQLLQGFFWNDLEDNCSILVIASGFPPSFADKITVQSAVVPYPPPKC